MSLLAPLKSLKIRLFSTFRIFKNCCQMTTNRLLIRKKALTVWKLQTIKVILYSNLFFMFSQDDTFALKLDKSLCPVIYSSYSNSQIKSYHYTLLYRYYGSIWFYMCSTVQSPQAVLNGVINLLSCFCYQTLFIR